MGEYSELRPVDGRDFAIITELSDRYPGVVIEPLDTTDMRGRIALVDEYGAQVQRNWPELDDVQREELGSSARAQAFRLLNQGGTLVRLSFTGMSGNKDFWPEVESTREQRDLAALSAPPALNSPVICERAFAKPIPLRWVDLREQQ